VRGLRGDGCGTSEPALPGRAQLACKRDLHAINEPHVVLRTRRVETQSPRVIDDRRYAHLRGRAEPTLGNLIRWERIKLWDAAQAAMALIEDRAPSTEDEAEALWGDRDFAALRGTMKKHRARIAELERMQAEVALTVTPDPLSPE
jgi:hypothetical protein